MNSIRILLADDQGENRDHIRRLMAADRDFEIIGEARDGLEAIQKVKSLNPDIVLMDSTMPKMDGITATEKIYLEHPGCAVIIIGSDDSPEYTRKVFKSGARDLMVKPLDGGELADNIKRIYQLERKRIAKPGDKGHNQKPQVITVFGTKGGVGKTTLAVNLAVLLASSRKKVVLVDLDLQFGDVSIFMNLMPKRTISELAQEGDQLDMQTVESYLVPHISGINALCAPSRPEYSELITNAHVSNIIANLKMKYDYVIIDTSPQFNEINITALELSSQILLVATLDIATLKNARLALELLESLHQKGKTKLILNRVSDDSEINLHNAEETLGSYVAAQVPSDNKLALAGVNRGTPVVMTNPGAKMSQGLKKVADLVVEDKGYQADLAGKHRQHGILQRFLLPGREKAKQI